MSGFAEMGYLAGFVCPLGIRLLAFSVQVFIIASYDCVCAFIRAFIKLVEGYYYSCFFLYDFTNFFIFMIFLTCVHYFMFLGFILHSDL